MENGELKMENFIKKHFKILNKLFGKYRWFQVIFKNVIENGKWRVENGIY